MLGRKANAGRGPSCAVLVVGAVGLLIVVRPARSVPSSDTRTKSPSVLHCVVLTVLAGSYVVKDR